MLMGERCPLELKQEKMLISQVSVSNCLSLKLLANFIIMTYTLESQRHISDRTLWKDSLRRYGWSGYMRQWGLELVHPACKKAQKWR